MVKRIILILTAVFVVSNVFADTETVTPTVTPTVTETITLTATETVTPTTTETPTPTITPTTTPGSVIWTTKNVIIRHLTIDNADGLGKVTWPREWHYDKPYTVQIQSLQQPTNSMPYIIEKNTHEVLIRMVDPADKTTAVDCSTTNAILDVFIFYKLIDYYPTVIPTAEPTLQVTPPAL